MSSIGPQLPPHLTKRKRTPDDESPESPAAKIQTTNRAPINEDEVNLDSDDDDDYGPSVPQTATKTSIGPTLPPTNKDEIPLDDSDDDDIGPSAPPPPAAPKPSIGPTLPPTNQDEIPLDSSEDEAGPAPPPAPTTPAPAPAGPSPARIKRIHGPAPPPAPLSERPPNPPNPDSESDSDDDYGPALPTSASHTTRAARAQAASAAALAAGPQRDDWMLAPPTSSGYRAPDPTKLKSRRFASGPRTNPNPSSGSSGGEISSIWTETPEQKRKRLENAVLGRNDPASQQQTSSGNGGGNGLGIGSGTEARTKEDQEQQERIRSFTEATRGKSLYDEHRDSRRGRTLAAEEEEDDPSKRAFDKEKDMKLGGRIGTAQRRELLNRAADFGGRFAKGKYL
ncbi:uncharacterized protein F4822DRAFT_392361 [Hypoxylon trugodes]|uniref:uncharacterized protein n=1 Tax=Hypoxylon trugodes TaxID=326681 RepID=UPI002190110E|nr:uncharacterized protein F4822DRAFT_392361 [Hypoxylon trugodes]KAI1392837.1 hypothetical protein F4822DRAFT_392361 [Hypoxylon trugodes]